MKKLVTMVLLSLLAVGGIAAVSYYYQTEVTGNIVLSIDAGASPVTMDCGTIFDDTNTLCGTFSLENLNGDARTVNIEVTEDVNSMDCIVMEDNGSVMTEVTTLSIPAATVEDFEVYGIAPYLADPGAATCIVTVVPA